MAETETETTITVYGAWSLDDARQIALGTATRARLVVTNLKPVSAGEAYVFTARPRGAIAPQELRAFVERS